MVEFILPTFLRNRYVLIDNFSVIEAIDIINSSKHSFDKILPGATLLESLVLYDKLAVDPLMNKPDRNIIHNSWAEPDKKPSQLSLSEKLLRSLGRFVEPQNGYVKNHYEVVEEVLSQIPGDIVRYISLPIKEKIELLESTRVCFPEMDFNWEWFLKKFSDERAIAAGNVESFFITATIYDLAEFMPENIKPTAETNSITLSRELGFFRDSGPIAKQAYYLALAGYLNIPYVPNYERNMFYKAYFSAFHDPMFAKSIIDNNFNSTSPDILNAQSMIIDYFNEKVIKRLNQRYFNEVLPWHNISYDIPPVLNRIYSYSQKKNCSPLDAALAIRETTPAKAFRKWCNNISLAYNTKNSKELRKLMNGFKDVCEAWRKKPEDPKINSKVVINIPPILSYETETPDPMHWLKRKYSKPLIFLRELI